MLMMKEHAQNNFATSIKSLYYQGLIRLAAKFVTLLNFDTSENETFNVTDT